MSLLFVISWIFIKMTTTVNSAPRLRHNMLYDAQTSGDKIIQSKLEFDNPIMSDGYLSDDHFVSNIRKNDQSSEITAFEGYIFDASICKHTNDRILCGYDRNKGENKKYIYVDLEDGCRMRGDRIECGYTDKVTKPDEKVPTLRAILTIPSRKTITERKIMLKSNPKETIIAVNKSDTFKETVTTILPIESSRSPISVSASDQSTPFSTRSNNNTIISPQVQFDTSDNIGQTVPTKFYASVRPNLAISTSATTSPFFPISILNTENNNDKINALPKPNRRMFEENNATTKAIMFNRTASNTTTAYKLKKDEEKDILHEQTLRVPKSLSEVTEDIPKLATRHTSYEEQSTATTVTTRLANFEQQPTTTTSVVLEKNVTSIANDSDVQSFNATVKVSYLKLTPTPATQTIDKQTIDSLNGSAIYLNTVTESSRNVSKVTEINTILMLNNLYTTIYLIEHSTANGGEVGNLRENSDKTKVKTVCVEQKDRVVCYDYKTIYDLH